MKTYLLGACYRGLQFSLGLSLFAIPLVLSGCNSTKQMAGRPDRVQIVDKDLEELTDDELFLVLVDTAYMLPADKKPSEALQALKDLDTNDLALKRAQQLEAMTLLDGMDQAALRRAYADRFIAIINVRYEQMVDVLVTKRKGFDAGSDVLAIALDTSAVLFAPASTKSILAGLSGLTTAGKTAINKVYFYDQTLPVLIAKMQADRQKVMAEIMIGLNKPDAEYDLTRLKYDLFRYVEVGTIDGALTQIARQASNDADDAEILIEQLTEQAKSNVAVSTRLQRTFKDDQMRYEIAKVLTKKWWATAVATKTADEIENLSIAVYVAGDEVGADLSSYKLAGASFDQIDPAKFDAMVDAFVSGQAVDQQLLAEIIVISKGGVPIPNWP